MGINDAAKRIIDSFKPELEIPETPMSPQEFAERLREYGVVCPDQCIFKEIVCKRPDFTGDRYSLQFYKQGISDIPAIELSITMRKDVNAWMLHMVFDARETKQERDWESEPMTKQWLRKMDSGDELKLRTIVYATENTTRFHDATVYMLTTQETLELTISPVELINAILSSQAEGHYNFVIDNSLLQPN